MARTIGVKNKNFVKRLTREEIEIQTDPISKETNFVTVEDNVIEKLPSKFMGYLGKRRLRNQTNYF